LKIAEAQQEEAKLSFQQTLLNAGIEVNNALSQVQSYGNRGVYYEQQVLSLKRAVTSTTALMKHGSNTYLEVLTAQQSLLSAQLTQLNNDYNKTVSVINLFKAL
ncbi:MAG: TolC family protein, partial [Bacteroidales bacterium]|nr:TolC family protein [Bacteroidales bacterium]